MVQMVEYYDLRRNSRAVNRGIAVVLGGWPERVKRHRGWKNNLLLCQRATTVEEDEFLNQCLRHQAWIYRSVDELLAEEETLLAPDVFQRIAAALRETGYCDE